MGVTSSPGLGWRSRLHAGQTRPFRPGWLRVAQRWLPCATMHANPVAHLVGTVGVHDKGADQEEEDAGGQHGQHGGGAPADEQLAHTPGSRRRGMGGEEGGYRVRRCGGGRRRSTGSRVASCSPVQTETSRECCAPPARQ